MEIGRLAPVILDVADDSDRSFAALTRYDVLLVNAVRDGSTWWRRKVRS